MTKHTKPPADAKYRIAFVKDTDARFEECNGKARPLTEEEYAENQYRGCPDHPRSKVPPARTEQGRGWCGECEKEYADIPYSEYRAYFGNPEMHRYIGTIVEWQAGIRDWQVGPTLWGSDFMRDDPALAVVKVGSEGTGNKHWYTPEEAIALPGYFGDLARELLEEARDE